MYINTEDVRHLVRTIHGPSCKSSIEFERRDLVVVRVTPRGPTVHSKRARDGYVGVGSSLVEAYSMLLLQLCEKGKKK